MNQELWRKVEEIFHAALERAPETRPAFLDRNCSGDIGLRRQVELLLAKEKQAGSFLETPAIATLTATRSLLGRQVGPYRIVSPLGAGGMGEVYRAHDSKLGRDVALKTLPAEFARDPQRLARLRREARTLASLNHPNIAAIYGLEESGEVDCLVLELVEGETLRGPLNVEKAFDCARQVADALEAAHDKGIIHRDLKPANVKMTPKGRVKVLDFGLAKAIWGSEGDQYPSQRAAVTGISTLAGHIVGTPGYMSPEQARGEDVDKRADLWAFGCLLYELLTGKRAFEGETLPDTIAAVLGREPDWQALPAKTPAKVRGLLRRCLQKNADRRLSNIGDARKAIEEAERGWNRWSVASIAIAVLTTLGIGAAVVLRNPARPPDRSEWVQLTKFPDPVSQPALSPDGRMLAFVRSPSTYYAVGQIYVKTLPDGEPVQLTHDSLKKTNPAFSPDGTRIAYTTVDPQFSWDTWVVPTQGGEPHLWLHANSLTWTGPRRVMFSETIRNTLRMGIVASDDRRIGEHDIYIPANDRGMALRSYSSPDGKRVLVAEFTEYGNWGPCRVVPMDGRASGRQVGPPGAACTFGAWSPDSKWVYLTTKAGGLYHIWRQRFPDGQPQQFTSGLTEEEGIAIAPGGRSFVTAVGLQSVSTWVHDARGERQISVLEGNAAYPRFTPDGKKVCYRIVKAVPPIGTNRDPGEVWVADLDSGHSEPLAPGFPVLDYDISPDSRQVLLEAPDSVGKPRIWLAPFDRRSPPRQIPNVEGRSALFGPGGEIFFRHAEGAASFVYRVRPDGTRLRKALEQPVFVASSFSPDGQWIEAWAPLPGSNRSAKQMFPLDGRSPVVIGSNTMLQWSSSGDCLWITSGAVRDGRTYIVPLPPGKILPPIPRGGFRSEEEIARLPGAHWIDTDIPGAPGPNRDVYAFERRTVQRNLYRIPIP
jgi:serine/threonine protein kinase